ncbi:hypothetical protein M407DRAFT_240857 [Tulasnella calospora MUT 4182]|uniref:RTA1 like protein n=1 Tax=Tulasnella calospora MUT 4182 TaxID=1051891 RepID=A0A0C3QXY0_9AGAM|nr:hypothetical protein M407DRAFT_240857 [Tulasnella calospora MUT 4182]
MGFKENGSNGFFFYDASNAAAIIFAIIFGALLALHCWQSVKYKTTFMIVLIISVVLEFFGYITRSISITNTDALWANIASQTTLIVAPAFLAAQDYMIIGRVMAYVGSQYGIINHNKITKIFVGADVLAIITQAGGGAMLAGAQGDIDQMKKAKNILLGGLVLQVITFAFFAFVAISFDLRSSRAPELKPYASEMRKMRKLWYAFYLSAVLVTVRSIYRTAEFGEVSFEPGKSTPDGYALTHEWLMYVLDSVPIFLSTAAFNLYHPGEFLPARKGSTIDGRQEAASNKSDVALQPV